MNKCFGIIFICFIGIFFSCTSSQTFENTFSDNKPQITDETWRNIISIEEILGDWISVWTVRNPSFPEFEISVIVSITKDYDKNYITDTTADFEQMLNVMANYIANSRGLVAENVKDVIWETVIESDNEQENRIVTWGKYFQRIIRIYPLEDEDRNFRYENYFIDNTGNRIKWYTEESISFMGSAVISYRK